ncbi:M48 family metalloprotease [Streptomyces sp. NPDC005811]|uniref:M48 family metalloprotease n=1 Tax=Streptomyces sp. NPDC005811 TaxID=3154565 RepID=UPI0033E623CB
MTSAVTPDRRSGEAGPDADPVNVFAFPRTTVILLPLLAVTVHSGNIWLMARFGGGVSGRAGDGRLARSVLEAHWLWYAGVSTFFLRDRLRRRRCRPLDGKAFPGLACRVEALAREMRLRQIPALLTEHKKKRDRGMASGFDLIGLRPYLSLGPSLLALGTADTASARCTFDAVIRHELAHLRNRDVLGHNLVMGVRLANLLQTLLIVTVSLTTGAGTDLAMAGSVLLFAFALDLVAREFLRAQEAYADQRAAQLGDKGPEGFAQALERGGRDVWVRGQHGRDTRALPRLLSYHRTREERAALVRAPGALLRFGLVHALVSGFLTGVALATVTQVLIAAGAAVGPAQDGSVIRTALSVGAPLGLLVGLGMARHAGNPKRTNRSPGPLLIAPVLAAGVLLGTRLSPYGTAEASVPFAPQPLLGLLVCCLLLTCWPWAATRAAAEPLRRWMWWLLAATAALVGASAVALLLLGALELLALYALLVAAPVLLFRVTALALRGWNRPQAQGREPAKPERERGAAGERSLHPAQDGAGHAPRSQAVGGAAGVDGPLVMSVLLIAACVAVGAPFGRAALENPRIALMLGSEPLGGTRGEVPELLAPVTEHWFALLTGALAVCAVALLGPRSPRRPGRALRAGALIAAPVVLVAVAGAWRSPDAAASPYCSPLTPQGGGVAVHFNIQPTGDDLDRVRDVLLGFKLTSEPEYESPEQVLRNLGWSHPGSDLVRTLVAQQLTPDFRAQLAEPAEMPRLARALRGVRLDEPLRPTDPDASLPPVELYSTDPCHPLMGGLAPVTLG